MNPHCLSPDLAVRQQRRQLLYMRARSLRDCTWSMEIIRLVGGTRFGSHSPPVSSGQKIRAAAGDVIKSPLSKKSIGLIRPWAACLPGSSLFFTLCLLPLSPVLA